MGMMFLPFQRYFDFQGRSRRLEFWLFFLFNIIVGAIFTTIFLVLFLGKIIEIAGRYGYNAYENYSTTSAGFEASVTLDVPPEILLAELGPVAKAMIIAYFIYHALVMIPALAVTVRRLHDTNRSGWWLLLPYGLNAVSLGLMIGAWFAPNAALAFALPAGLIGLFAGLAALALLIFLLFDGTPGPNRYGPSPKGYDVPRTFG